MGNFKVVTRFSSKSKKAPSKGRKFKASFKPRARPAVPKTVKRYVKAAISSTIEDKYADAFGSPVEPIVRVNAGSGPYQYFTAPLFQNLTDITLGMGQGQRISQQITLKKHIVRGLLTHNNTGALTSPQGYVDVYIGYKNDDTLPDAAITDFYQNGNSYYSPTTTAADLQQWINKSLYNVKWHRRFKMGMASAGTGTLAPNDMPNNDFSLTKTFSVDLCQLAFKNAKVKYPTQIASTGGAPPAPPVAPIDFKFQKWFLWTTFVNANGTASARTAIEESCQQIQILLNTAYEDA